MPGCCRDGWVGGVCLCMSCGCWSWALPADWRYAAVVWCITRQCCCHPPACCFAARTQSSTCPHTGDLAASPRIKQTGTATDCTCTCGLARFGITRVAGCGLGSLALAVRPRAIPWVGSAAAGEAWAHALCVRDMPRNRWC